MIKRSSYILPLFLVLALTLTACNFNSNKGNTAESTTGESAKPGTKQVLNVIETEELTLDSVLAHTGTSFTVLNNVTEGLFRLGANNSPVNGIAEKHEQSADGLVHTFTLRDAKWSDGTKVTANDFVFAWQRIFKEVGDYQTMFVDANFLNAKDILDKKKSPEELGVKAIDEKTLQVTLQLPNPLLESYLTFTSFLPQNQKFVEGKGKDYALEASNLLFNGPFILTDWKHDQSWQYQKNPNYWDVANVKLDEINVNVVKEVSTAVKLFEAGTVDRVVLSGAYAEQYRQDPRFQTMDTSEPYFLRLNHKNAAFANTNIRKAVSMAINREDLANVILNNGSKPFYGLVPHNFSVSPDGKDFRELNGDFNKGTAKDAQDLFAKGLTELGKTALEVSIMTADEDYNKKTAEYLKDQLEKNLPGLTVNIKMVPIQQRLELEKAKDYDISISSWGPDYGDPMTYIGMWVTNGSANRMNYSNPEYDALVDKAKVEIDKTKRYQMLLDAEKILLEKDAAIVPLYQLYLSILQNPSVKGLVSPPFGADYSYKWTSIEAK
jgi:oligopeptide transport system substrate-binding protein